MKNNSDEFVPVEKDLSAYSKDEIIQVLRRTLQRIGIFERKYFQLVWYARSDPKAEDLAVQQQEVETLYPKEIKALSGDSGDWEHGFNSGCLATARLFAEYLDVLRTADTNNQYFLDQVEADSDDGETESMTEAEIAVSLTNEVQRVIEEAEEEFPFLDT